MKVAREPPKVGDEEVPGMGKIAFLYPGQGSQRVGMGADLQKSNPELFERYLAQADSVSALPISRYCLEGPIESLTETQVAQPALFALSLALTDYARQIGLRPDYVAGHSLGEYTAATVSGVLNPEDGLRVVCERGRLMAETQSERPGAMAAIIGLSADRLRELCQTASQAGMVTLANLNTPTQIVVSGEDAGVEKLMELAREAGAEKVVRLQVGAGFHTELMQPVQARLAQFMETVTWNEAQAPLAANASGELVTRTDDVRRALIAQIASPVQWVACVQTLVQAGCTTFLELGSGRVLTGLVRQINPDVETFAADSPQKVSTFAQGHEQFVRR
jgi:[acyl-carrier-protein] S-malonyltransferase